MVRAHKGVLLIVALLALCLALVVSVRFLGKTPTAISLAAKAGTTAVQSVSLHEVGVAPVGRTAMEFTGRIDQNGPNFNIYGYVTYLYGLPPGLLFTDAITHSEGTARITLSGTAVITEHTVISNVFHIDAIGNLQFYFDEEQGATFDDLQSFSRGQAVASAKMRLSNVLTVIGQNVGVTAGEGEIVQSEALTFTLENTTYQFGKPRVVDRVNFSGGGVRFTPVPPVAVIAIGGVATTAGFDTFVPTAQK